MSSLFQDALQAIRAGGDYRISARSLTVNDQTFELNDEQADLAWDAIEEGDDGR